MIIELKNDIVNFMKTVTYENQVSKVDELIKLILLYRDKGALKEDVISLIVSLNKEIYWYEEGFKEEILSLVCSGLEGKGRYDDIIEW